MRHPPGPPAVALAAALLLSAAGRPGACRAQAAPAPSGLAPADSGAAPVAVPPAVVADVVISGAGGPLISPTRAVLVTPLFPGWGQLYARSGWRAALAWGATGFYGAHLLRNDRRAARWQERSRLLPEGSAARLTAAAYADEFRERVRDYAWWELGALLIIALDAYVDAHLYGFDRDPVTVPNRWDEAAAAPGGADPAEIAGAVFLRWSTRF